MYNYVGLRLIAEKIVFKTFNDVASNRDREV